MLYASLAYLHYENVTYKGIYCEDGLQYQKLYNGYHK